MSRVNKLTIKQASELLKKGKIISVELTEACLKRIKEVNGKIKACLTVCEEEALTMADEADRRRARGESGELLGIPYLVKDNIMTKGIKTTAASKILEDYVAPYDATVVKKLKEAGAVMLGKTNLDEFAHGASTENSVFGPTHNPWDLERVPGGSSGGSAAAVAADMCLFAIGTDTGGSIRHPASYCGVVGLKPTYGRCSRHGLIAMTSSTDVPGPITKTIKDAAIVLKAVAGVDRLDSTTVDQQIDDYTSDLEGDIRGLKIGLPKEFYTEDINKEVINTVKRAIEKLEELGVEFIEINLPYTKYAVATYYIITPSEISSNLSRFDGIKYGLSESEAKNLMEAYLESRGKGFGPEVKRRIMLGTFALSAGYFDAYYKRAQKVRTVITKELDRELANIDALLTPATPNIAFKIGAKADPLAMYLEDIFLASASLAGLPAMSVPCGFVAPPQSSPLRSSREGRNEAKLPVGMQLIGKRFDEDVLFRIGQVYQRVTDWHEKKPKLSKQ